MKDIILDYYKELKIYFKKINKKTKYLFTYFKSFLLSSNKRKVNLIILGTLIMVNILFLLKYPSFAIYQNNYEFSVLEGIIGDKNINEFDYMLLVYVEDTTSGIGNGTYILTGDIPISGYTYSGYECKNDSILIYNEEMKTVTVTTDEIEVCSIYFDFKNDSDVAIKIMLEESIGSNTYTTNNLIPYSGYKYSHYECDHNGILNYNSEKHSILLSTQVKEYCNIYFKKVSNDIQVNLFVEDTYNTGKYIEKNNIPSNKLYKLNESYSECLNNNERIEATISYVDGNIEIATSKISYCNVYLDLLNE